MSLYTTLTSDYPEFASLGAAGKHMIIDAKLLRGIDETPYLLTAHSDADVVAQGRDGLFEIYHNIVSNFIEQMIASAEEYANESTEWYHRADPQTELGNPGVAYNNGGIDTVQQFENKITYNEGQGTINSWLDYWDGYVDNNSMYPPGMYSSEVFTSHDLWGYSADYDPRDWAGIDCRGLVQRASKSPLYSNSEMMISDIIIPDLSEYGESEYGDSSDPWGNIQNNIACSDYRWVFGSFVDNTTTSADDKYANCYTIADDAFDTESRWLHRGDIITSSSHVVIVYEEPADDYSKTYNIINAYGDPWTEFTIGIPEFTRKVMIFDYDVWKDDSYTRQRSDIRYGRFLLWQE